MCSSSSGFPFCSTRWRSSVARASRRSGGGISSGAARLGGATSSPRSRSLEPDPGPSVTCSAASRACGCRSEEHTSELQSQSNLVCRLLLEKKKKKNHIVSTNLAQFLSYLFIDMCLNSTLYYIFVILLHSGDVTVNVLLRYMCMTMCYVE